MLEATRWYFSLQAPEPATTDHGLALASGRFRVEGAGCRGIRALGFRGFKVSGLWALGLQGFWVEVRAKRPSAALRRSFAAGALRATLASVFSPSCKP